MKQKKRDKNLIFKVNEDEWNIIQKRLEPFVKKESFLTGTKMRSARGCAPHEKPG